MNEVSFFKKFHPDVAYGVLEAVHLMGEELDTIKVCDI